jgi:WD40 repeat protein
MVRISGVFAGILAVVIPLLGLLVARADGPKPLSEADLLKLIELQIREKAIIARVEKAGVDFKMDDAVIERLKKAGASEAVLAAVRKGKTAEQPESPTPQTRDKPELSFLIRGHTSPVLATAIGPDGKTLATGSEDKTIRLWDLTTRKRLALLRHTDPVRALAFSADGKTLAAGDGEGKITMWDVAEGKRTGASFDKNKELDKISYVAFAPDGKTLAALRGGPGAWSGREIGLWDVATGKVRFILNGHREGVNALAFAPDSKTLASASGDETVRLWDVATGKERDSLKGHDGEVTFVAYVPDGRHLASAGSKDKTVTIWDVNTGNVTATLEGHKDSVRFVGYTTDGKTLLSLCKDGTAICWDVAAKKQRTKFTYAKATGQFYPAEYGFARKGHFVAIGNMGEADVVVYDLSHYLKASE